MNSWVGQNLGKVHIDALLARGGMAEVYIGTHTTLHRLVAVKVLRNNYEEYPHALERFQREAIVVGNLRHPNIVHVFDFDLVDSHPYLVMEYIKGPSLLKYLNSLHEEKKKLDNKHVIRVMDAMTSALQYAHDSGVIHRDIKPGNILLTSRTSGILLGKPLPDDFEPVLTDFGLVRFIDSTQHTTGSGQIAGTPAYMSPEQAAGKLTDGRTDVYSLGIVLYEILAGHVPFEGETTMGVLMKHINELPTPIPGLPPAFQYLLDRALAKDVEVRFQTPAEFGEAFREAAENPADFSTLDMLSRKPTRKAVRKPLKRGSRSKWIGTVLGGLVVIGVAAGLVFSNVFPLASSSTSTATPGVSSTGTIPIASNTITLTGTPSTTILLGQTGVLQFKEQSSVADRADLVATSLLAPPLGSQYEVWLVGDKQRLSLGILSLDGNGRGELTFTDPQKVDLIASFDAVEVTIEPKPDTDPASSGLVAYSFIQAQEALPHLRSLLATSPDTPNQTSLIQGLSTDIVTIDELANEMKKASSNGNADRLRLNAEAIMNTIAGNQSPNYKDWNNDGQADNPSDGYGLLLNGRNLGYLQATYIEANTAAQSTGTPEQMKTYGEGVKNSVQNLAQWSGQLEDMIIDILATPPPTDLAKRVDQAAKLADQMVNGIDLDQGGVVEPLPGEAGVLVAYEQAFHMADMPLKAVGIQNIGTGTPTFFPITPTKTPGNSGSHGGVVSTPGPALNTPPAQQSTSRPPAPGPQKTKEPPPGQVKTNRPPKPTKSGNGNGNNGGNGTP